ncbi:response regulator [Devosia pacifica]|nr:response regulator [Devosia pacifica]
MPNRPIKVLYIDDDPGLARLVQRTLERRGYGVEHVDNAEAGLARIREGGIDVVGLDHYLPVGTGLDVLAELKDAPGAPPVVYVTGSAETAVAVSALKAGAFDYVSKSIADDFLELLGSTIDQAVERARLMRAKERAEAELVEAKDRAELLLREVNHRVANSLSMVAAMVRMQAHAVSEAAAKDALAETQARISAISGVHRRLYTSDDVRFVDAGEYLTGLIEELQTSISAEGSNARLLLDLQAIRIPTDKAVSVGVIATELVTNAFKYAYPDGEEGEVRILLNRQGDGVAHLIIEDDGVGWSDDKPIQGTGLGTRLIKSMATNIGSTVSYAAKDKGTRAILSIEL